MSRDVHVRFRESRRGETPPVTHLVVEFERLRDAKQLPKGLRERFAKFDLELRPDNTRLKELGQFAALNGAARRFRKPETFDFRGFTHICLTPASRVCDDRTRDSGLPRARPRNRPPL